MDKGPFFNGMGRIHSHISQLKGNPKKLTTYLSSEGSKDFELPGGTDDEVPKEDGERKGERQDEAVERCL